MLTLARFSLGRIFLHLVAMLRDGAFRCAMKPDAWRRVDPTMVLPDTLV